jgi:5-methylcytosine-specific restriction protein A
MMSINAALNLLLELYPKAKSEQFAKNEMASFLRHDIPDEIRQALGNGERYEVQGSAGQGTWAFVPWVAILDRLITDTPQKGYYLVYLVKEDFSGVFLSLNQGVTDIRERYQADAKQALRARTFDFLARLGKLTDGLIIGKIDLAVRDPIGLGAFYEHGAICSTYYAKDDIPEDEKLASDLLRFTGLYFTLVAQDPTADFMINELSIKVEKAAVDKEAKRVLSGDEWQASANGTNELVVGSGFSLA